MVRLLLSPDVFEFDIIGNPCGLFFDDYGVVFTVYDDKIMFESFYKHLDEKEIPSWVKEIIERVKKIILEKEDVEFDDLYIDRRIKEVYGNDNDFVLELKWKRSFYIVTIELGNKEKELGLHVWEEIVANTELKSLLRKRVIEWLKEVFWDHILPEYEKHIIGRVLAEEVKKEFSGIISETIGAMVSMLAKKYPDAKYIEMNTLGDINVSLVLLNKSISMKEEKILDELKRYIEILMILYEPIPVYTKIPLKII